MMSFKEELRSQLLAAANKINLKKSRSRSNVYRDDSNSSSKSSGRHHRRKINKTSGADEVTTDRKTTSSNSGSGKRKKLKNTRSKKSSSNSSSSKPSTPTKVSKPSVSTSPYQSPQKVKRRRSLNLVDLSASLSKIDEIYYDSDADNFMEDLSSSTYTMSESCLGTSYSGFLGGSAHNSNPIIATGNASFHHLLHHSTNELDCIDLLIITNVWERIKRLEGYQHDFCEILVCHMMEQSEFNVRRQLCFSSFRSTQFALLAEKIVDQIEVLVTLLGPDMDENDLLQVGQDLVQQGVNLPLFGNVVAPALREYLGQDKFPQDDYDICDRVFRWVCNKIMEG